MLAAFNLVSTRICIPARAAFGVRVLSKLIVNLATFPNSVPPSERALFAT